VTGDFNFNKNRTSPYPFFIKDGNTSNKNEVLYFTSYFHKKMKYANIKKYDVSNGVGVRVSLFVSGCRHHCKGCFNAEAWDFNYGTEFTQETIDEIIESLKPDYINGLSLL
jgi:hypothetical protein